MKWVYTCVVTAVIKEKKKKRVIPPGIEPGTLSVLDSRDNHYTMESTAVRVKLSVGFITAVYTVVE